MRVHILDGGSLIGEGEYDPQTGLLSNVRNRGKSLANSTVALISKANASLTFIGDLKSQEGGFKLIVNAQT